MEEGHVIGRRPTESSPEAKAMFADPAPAPKTKGGKVDIDVLADDFE